MISFPEGFDASLLVSDFFGVGSLIVGVVTLIVCARWIIKAVRG